MKKKFLALAAFLFVAVGLAYAHTNTTEISRSQLAHPDLGFEGGATLHSAVAAVYTQLGDNANSRFIEFAGIGNSVTQTIEHNLGVDIDELQVLIYTGNHPNLTRISDPTGSGWVIAAGPSAKTEIDVTTPSSGGPHTFAVITIHGKGSEIISDLDDVNVTTPVDGQVLTYDSTAGEWQNKDPETSTGGTNLLPNPGWEKSPDNTGYSVSGGTIDITTTEGEYLAGTQSGTWDSDGNAQTYESVLVNVPLELEGNSCSVQIRYLADGITSGDYIIDVYDGAGDTVDARGAVDFIPTSGSSYFVYKAFICPTRAIPGTPAQIRFRITSTVADADLLTLDTAHLGDNIRAGFTSSNETYPAVQTSLTGSDFTNDTGLTITGRVTGQRINNNLHLTFLAYYNNSGTDVGALTFTIPSSIASGITIPTGFYGAGSGRADAAVAADKFPTSMAFRASGTNELTFSENLSTSINGTSIGSVDATDIEYMSITAILPVNEWVGDNTETVTLETQGAYFKGAIVGANVNLPVTATAYGVAANSNLSLSGKKGNIVCNIACVTGETASGDTCSASEILGLSCVAPYSGKYKVCSSVNNLAQLNVDGQILNTAFRIDQIANADNSVIVAKGLSVPVANFRSGVSSTQISVKNISLCETFDLSAGRNTFALKNTVGVTGSPAANQIIADGSSGNGLGERNNTWEFYPITQNFPQAVAIADIESGATADCMTGNICSGRYAPTDNTSTGIASTPTWKEAIFYRFGKEVCVTGEVSYTASGSATQNLKATLPIPTTCGNNDDVMGAVSSNTANDFKAIANCDTANNGLQIQTNVTASQSYTAAYNVCYKILP